ncbi:uncharacterized protein RAG0_03438 [Rhynchosporium agropyri]|uniref:Uncharacterized protein n=1 Tax=Rhynchosporium agropyri TaxID=914238 RepID=A0A1E1K8L0_9HELO|nr:uncharacterized protein RAG0_03438 [Rhynchosporium agropyri]
MVFITSKVAIRSENFDRFLVIDGDGISSFVEPGFGNVTSSKTLGPLSTLYMDRYNNNTVAIRAPNHPGVFLRLDADDKNEHTFGWAWEGFGVANCQYSKENLPARGGKETFEIVAHPDGAVSFRSVAYPGAYLRMDDVGKVNCQCYGEGRPSSRSWELFKVILLE